MRVEFPVDEVHAVIEKAEMFYRQFDDDMNIKVMKTRGSASLSLDTEFTNANGAQYYVFIYLGVWTEGVGEFQVGFGRVVDEPNDTPASDDPVDVVENYFDLTSVADILPLFNASLKRIGKADLVVPI